MSYKVKLFDIAPSGQTSARETSSPSMDWNIQHVFFIRVWRMKTCKIQQNLQDRTLVALLVTKLSHKQVLMNLARLHDGFGFGSVLVDIIWDVYRKESSKKDSRERRGKGKRRKETADTSMPTDWHSFLRVENKTELYRLFLTNQVV